MLVYGFIRIRFYSSVDSRLSFLYLKGNHHQCRGPVGLRMFISSISISSISSVYTVRNLKKCIEYVVFIDLYLGSGLALACKLMHMSSGASKVLVENWMIKIEYILFQIKI